MKRLRILLLLFLCALACVPETRADDTASVESEALEIADRLRCMVCSNPNIEEAGDETAQDLRFFIRRHLTDGKPQDLVVNLVLANYGEMVSLEVPPHVSSDGETLFCRVLTGCFFVLMLISLGRRARKYRRMKQEGRA